MDESLNKIDPAELNNLLNIEASRGKGNWTSEDFRLYLLSLAYNSEDKDFYLERRTYPQSIELSGIWHERFSEMRAAFAKDLRSRWSIVGVTIDADKVIISPEFVEKPEQGEELTLEEIVDEDMKFFAMIDKMLEDKKLAFELGNISVGGEYKNHDLVSYVATRKGTSLYFYVAPDQTIAIFKSHETKQGPLTSARELMEQKKTVGEWYSELDKQPLNDLFDKFNLVVYTAKPDQNLIRVRP